MDTIVLVTIGAVLAFLGRKVQKEVDNPFPENLSVPEQQNYIESKGCMIGVMLVSYTIASTVFVGAALSIIF